MLVDTRHELLVNKLGALLSRSEIRDLADVRELAEGGDLERALRDAGRKDGGFSPLSLLWILKGLPVEELSSDFAPSLRDGLPQFRDELVNRISRLTAPVDPGL